jgi:O-methyltransferase involved in polyketide biosynthesis
MPNPDQAVTTMQNQMQAVNESWRKHGLDIDMTDLWYGGERNDVVGYLSAHGWTSTATTLAELWTAAGLSMPTHGEDEAAMFSNVAYAISTRG